MPHCLSLNVLVILVHHLSITHFFSPRAVHLIHHKGLGRKTANFTKMLAMFLPLSETVSLFHFWVWSKFSPQPNVEHPHSTSSVQQTDLQCRSHTLNLNEGPRRYRIAWRLSLAIAWLSRVISFELGCYKLLAFLLYMFWWLEEMLKESLSLLGERQNVSG